MLQALINWWRERRAIRMLLKDDTYRSIILTLREELSDQNEYLGKYATQETKKELAGQIIRKITIILSSNNPLMANREYLCGWVCQLAAFGVLVLPPSPKEDITGLRGKPGITGELRKHIKALSEKDEDLKKFIWSQNKKLITEEDLYWTFLFQYWVAALHLKVANLLCIVFGDYHPDANKDWHRPFVAAMYAWYEHLYRDKLGLEDILATMGQMGSLEGFKYSTYMDFVLKGEKYPNYSWEESYKEKSNSSLI